MTIAVERLFDLGDVSGPSALYVTEQRFEVLSVVPQCGVAVPPRPEPLTHLDDLRGAKRTDGEK